MKFNVVLEINSKTLFDVSVKKEEKLVTPLYCCQTYSASSLEYFAEQVIKKDSNPARIIEKRNGSITTWQIDIPFKPSEYLNYLVVPLDMMSEKFAAVYSHKFIQYAICWYKQNFSTNKISVNSLWDIVTRALTHPGFYTETGDYNPVLFPVYQEWKKVQRLISKL